MPQRKEPLAEAHGTIPAAAWNKPLQLADGAATGSPHRRFVVFGGTQVIQHDERAVTPGVGSEGKIYVPRAPDKGCLGLVLRSGFETSQVLVVFVVLVVKIAF